MMKGLIQLAYRKQIDASARTPWEKAVFAETYQEFFMQAQQYDQQGAYPTFQELLTHVPRAGELHYLTSRVAMGYLQQLQQRMPDVVNAFGEVCLPFTQFKFEILASHIHQKDSHRIAITFYSDPLSWIDTVGNQLLIAYGDQQTAIRSGQEINTDMIAMLPNLSIWSYRLQPLFAP